MRHLLCKSASYHRGRGSRQEPSSPGEFELGGQLIPWLASHVCRCSPEIRNRSAEASGRRCAWAQSGRVGACATKKEHQEHKRRPIGQRESVCEVVRGSQTSSLTGRERTPEGHVLVTVGLDSTKATREAAAVTRGRRCA